MAKYTSFADMFDGGGAGRSGNKFQGGGVISDLGNMLFSPYGSGDANIQQPMAPISSQRPQSRPVENKPVVVQNNTRNKNTGKRPQQRPQIILEESNINDLNALRENMIKAGIPLNGKNNQQQIPLDPVSKNPRDEYIVGPDANKKLPDRNIQMPRYDTPQFGFSMSDSLIGGNSPMAALPTDAPSTSVSPELAESGLKLIRDNLVRTESSAYSDILGLIERNGTQEQIREMRKYIAERSSRKPSFRPK